MATTEALIPTQAKKAKDLKSIVNGGSDAKPAKKVEASDKPSEKKDRKATKTSGNPVKETSNGVSAPTISKTEKGTSKKQKGAKEKVEPKSAAKQTEDKDQEVDEDSEDEIDDQTEALLQGFESDGDEEDEKAEELYKSGDAVPPITANGQLSKRKQQQLKKAADFPKEGKPGTVFVGRIPHGFYEHEMKAYFGQFGAILQLRLSRNKRTGASKHFAFIQFQDASVADIVAKTMDNYLMFGHLLKVKFVPEEQVPAGVWKGANKRFKKVPWNKMQGRKLEQGASEEVWEKRNQTEQERRDKKAKKMKAIGYEFDAPPIQSPKGVSKAKAVAQLTQNEGEIKAIEAAPAAEESSKLKKKKKKSKAAKEDEGAGAVEEASKSEKEADWLDAKLSKEDVEESVAALIAETTEKTSKKAKKDKKKNKEAAIPELTGADGEATPAMGEQPAESSSKAKKDKNKKQAKVEAK